MSRRASGLGCSSSPHRGHATAARGSTFCCDATAFAVNHKLTHRIYCEEQLQVRRSRRKRVAAAPREAMPVPARPHQRWSMDFVSDSLLDGRSIRALNVVDDCTRTCVAIEVDVSLPR